MKNRFSRLYHLETLIMMGLFILTTLVLSRVFVAGRLVSQQAEHLNDAVFLAENTAEMVKASNTGENLAAMLHAEPVSEADGIIKMTVRYDQDRQPSENGYYTVSVTIIPDQTREKDYQAVITVSGPDDNSIYELELADGWKELAHE